MAPLKAIVRRITVQADQLAIVFDLAAVWGLDEGSEPPHLTEVTAPAQLKRCGMAMRLVLPSTGQQPRRGADPKLVGLLTKAHDWFERLRLGQCDSVQEIAREEQVTGSYVARVIQLAFLAPDIVQKIQRAEHPLEINANGLLRMVPLPLCWEEQRAQLGMTA